jgi:hypothetical protein
VGEKCCRTPFCFSLAVVVGAGIPSFWAEIISNSFCVLLFLKTPISDRSSLGLVCAKFTLLFLLFIYLFVCCCFNGVGRPGLFVCFFCC